MSECTGAGDSAPYARRQQRLRQFLRAASPSTAVDEANAISRHAKAVNRLPAEHAQQPAASAAGLLATPPHATPRTIGAGLAVQAADEVRQIVQHCREGG